MITHHTLEDLHEVKTAFSKEGNPHLNGDSCLVINLATGSVTLDTKANVAYADSLENALAKAMELLGIRCRFFHHGERGEEEVPG